MLAQNPDALSDGQVFQLLTTGNGLRSLVSPEQVAGMVNVALFYIALKAMRWRAFQARFFAVSNLGLAQCPPSIRCLHNFRLLPRQDQRLHTPDKACAPHHQAFGPARFPGGLVLAPVLRPGSPPGSSARLPGRRSPAASIIAPSQQPQVMLLEMLAELGPVSVAVTMKTALALPLNMLNDAKER